MFVRICIQKSLIQRFPAIVPGKAGCRLYACQVNDRLIQIMIHVNKGIVPGSKSIVVMCPLDIHVLVLFHGFCQDFIFLYRDESSIRVVSAVIVIEDTFCLYTERTLMLHYFQLASILYVKPVQHLRIAGIITIDGKFTFILPGILAHISADRNGKLRHPV